jgi:hypothetical protein
MIQKDAIVRKVGPNKWCLYSRKKNPKTGKRRNLGCYSSLAGVKKRERQVQFFKRGSAMKATNLVPRLDKIARVLKASGDLKSYRQVKGAKRVLTAASKGELRKWLMMTPAEAKRLSDVKLYKILSTIIPEMEELSARLEDLEHIFDLCKDGRIKPLAKKHKAKVLQFRELLVGVIKAPSTDVHAVVRVIEERFPRMRKKIAKIKAQHTTLVTRVLKTTTDKVEQGEARGFPSKIAPKRILSHRIEAMVKAAGFFSSILMLAKRIKGGILAVWDTVKTELSELIDSMFGDITDVDGIIDDMSSQLAALI